MARAFVTGAAGFIGSNLVDHLLENGWTVVAYDNLSTGMLDFLSSAKAYPKFSFVRGDVLDVELLAESMSGADIVFHLSANADVRFGTLHPRRDLDQNTIATFNVLEAMRKSGIKDIVFSSTGSVYGDAKVVPTPENGPFPIQTSLYGASKVACEGLITSYCEGFDFRSFIFRFVSVLGERYTHGHVFDFYKRLRQDPTHLHILGDGRQRKSYMYVKDCVEAITLAMGKSTDKINVYNLGVDGYAEVNQSVAWITGRLGLSPTLTYAGGERGWVGDSPFIYLDTSRIRALGWEPKVGIQAAVLRTVDWLQTNEYVLERP